MIRVCPGKRMGSELLPHQAMGLRPKVMKRWFLICQPRSLMAGQQDIAYSSRASYPLSLGEHYGLAVTALEVFTPLAVFHSGLRVSKSFFPVSGEAVSRTPSLSPQSQPIISAAFHLSRWFQSSSCTLASYF
jgi:hypothetical protein